MTPGVLHLPGFVSHGAQLCLPQWLFCHGILLYKRAPIVGPALSVTLTLHVFLVPFTESSASWSFFFKAELGVYGQKRILSILAGMFCFFPLALNVGFLTLKMSFVFLVLFLNQSDLPVSFCALLFVAVAFESLLSFPFSSHSFVHYCS